jgi:hypothetical protein
MLCSFCFVHELHQDRATPSHFNLLLLLFYSRLPLRLGSEDQRGAAVSMHIHCCCPPTFHHPALLLLLLLLAGSEDNTVRLWDASGSCLATIEHPGCVWAVAFTPAGDLVSGCSDAVARVWSAAAERQVRLGLWLRTNADGGAAAATARIVLLRAEWCQQPRTRTASCTGIACTPAHRLQSTCLYLTVR